MTTKFKDFVDLWKRKCRLLTSESWKMTQDQVIAKHILPFIGEKTVTKITPADISLIIQASKDKGHAPNTTKKIYMVLSKVFNDAVEFFEVVKKSPVKKRYHLPFVPKVKRPFMKFDQAIVLLEYCMHHALYGLPIWIMTLAGLRISEVEALFWTDIDFDNDIISVTKSFCYASKTMRNYTKNKNQYTVPIPPLLREYLFNRRKLGGLVCTSQSGGMLKRMGLKCYLRRTCARLSMPIRSSHGLRHSCARIYVEKGASDEQIMELLGHKWLASSKTYTHREDLDFLKRISKKIA